ncbi:MAG: phage tail sheath family protein [Elainellaceae cyanobacterium]
MVFPNEGDGEFSPDDSLAVQLNAALDTVLNDQRLDEQTSSELLKAIVDGLDYDPNQPDILDTGEYFQVRIERDGEVLTCPERDENDSVVLDSDGRPKSKAAVYRHLTMDATVDSKVGTGLEEALKNNPFIDVIIDATDGLALARRPADGVYEVSPPLVTYRVNRWYPRVYGNRQDRTGVQGLFEIDEVAMVACPDLMLAYQKGLLDLDQVHGVMELMITSCENAAPSPAYRMAVIDPPPVRVNRSKEAISPEQQKPQDVEQWLMDHFGRRSQFAALYYPWLQVPDPRESGKPKLVPPCGHMMGIWCRTDESRGIFKAPANEVPRGVVGLAYDTNFREQELLNPKGINCIRKFRDRGTLVWGARTLAALDDVNWRYVSVRRLMSYISKSIETGTQWAVFEPNDEDLWARVTRTVKNFLERIWREGALFGSTPEEAFYVKCDAELNTPETMKLGLLYVEVGVAPVRPAEFIIFRISQWDPTQDQSR